MLAAFSPATCGALLALITVNWLLSSIVLPLVQVVGALCKRRRWQQRRRRQQKRQRGRSACATAVSVLQTMLRSLMGQRRKGSSSWLGCMYGSGRGLDGDCLLTSVTDMISKASLVAAMSSWHCRALQERSRPTVEAAQAMSLRSKVGLLLFDRSNSLPWFRSWEGRGARSRSPNPRWSLSAPRLEPRRH